MMNSQKERYKITFPGDNDPAPKINFSNLSNIRPEDLGFNHKTQKYEIYKGLYWDATQHIKDLMTKSGVDCDIQVVMDAESLKNASYIANHKRIINEKTKGKYSFRFNRNKLCPRLFSLPHTDLIFAHKSNEAVGYISSLKFTLNEVISLCIAFAIGIIIQIKFSSYLYHRLGEVLPATLLALIVFFLCLILLPNAISLRRSLSVNPIDKNDGQFWIHQLKRYHPINKYFLLINAENEPLAKFHRCMLAKRCVCMDISNNLIFTATEDSDLDDAALDTMQTIREKLFDFGMLETLKEIADHFRGFTGKKYHKTKYTIVIRDKGNRIVGELNVGSDVILTMHEPISSGKGKLVLAFGIFSAGV